MEVNAEADAGPVIGDSEIAETMGLGAFAMMTSAESRLRDGSTVWLDDSTIIMSARPVSCTRGSQGNRNDYKQRE